MKKILLLSLMSLISAWTAYSQYTQIPNSGFEQRLIDLGIDSEGVLDGQVLTSDIEGVEELRLHNISYSRLRGLEDFTSLKTLELDNCSGDYTLNLSMVESLENFHLYGQTDNVNTLLNHIDFTNNPNLKKILLIEDWAIRSINLKGSDQFIDSLLIDYWAGGDISFRGTQNNGNELLLCVEVTNPEDAENQQGDYANWNAYGVYFTTDCTLSISDFELANFKIYPNPAKDFFQIESTVEMESISVYDVQGKEIKTFSGLQESYSVSDLSSGLYFLKIQLKSGENFTKKLLVE